MHKNSQEFFNLDTFIIGSNLRTIISSREFCLRIEGHSQRFLPINLLDFNPLFAEPYFSFLLKKSQL